MITLAPLPEPLNGSMRNGWFPHRAAAIITLGGVIDNSDGGDTWYSKLLPTFDRLCEAGSNLNIEYPHNNLAGSSILHHAILTRDHELVEHCLRYKADPNFTFDCSLNQLSHALLSGGVVDTFTFRIVELLLQYGADPNRYDTEHKDNPLHYAIKMNIPHYVKILIEYGADPSIRINVMNAYDYAVSLGHLDLRDLILETRQIHFH